MESVKGHRLLRVLVFLTFSTFFMVSCSGHGGSHDRAGGESIYDPGASIEAVGFDEAYPIQLKVQDPSGVFVPVADGQYVAPGKIRFAVTVKGDSAQIDRVLLSDGGGNQVEATPLGDSYVCDFEIGGKRLYSAVLVQVVHKDNRASKEKFVFRTTKDDQDDTLILNGVGVLASRDLLDVLKDQLAPVLDSYVRMAFEYIQKQDSTIVSKLSYGDSNPDTSDIEVNVLEPARDGKYPSAVCHLVFTIHDVVLSAVTIHGQDLITTKDNDLTVDTYVGLDDLGMDNKRRVVIDFMGSAQVRFRDDFFLRTVLEDIISSEFKVIEHPPLAADLENVSDIISALLPKGITIDDTAVDIAALFDKQVIDLSKYLFIDLYGIPDDTSSGVLALGAGLYIASDKSVQKETLKSVNSAAPDLEGVIIDICQVMVDKAFQDIKQQYNGLVTELSYGDNDTQTPDFTINSLSIQDAGNALTKKIQANFTINAVDFRAASLFGISLINTRDNDLTIDASFLLTTDGSGGQVVLVLDVQDVTYVKFHDYFLGRLVVEELAKDTIRNEQAISTDISTVLADLSLDIDLSGCWDKGLLFPDVLLAYSPYKWDLSLPSHDSLSLAVSEDNINWALARLFTQGFEWDIYEILRPLMGKDFAGFTKDRVKGEETIMRFSVPPVLDLRSSDIRLEADDVIIEYRLDGEPQWEASVDLDLCLDTKVADRRLELYLSSVPENCHFHVMRDNGGKLGIFDHSNLVNDIVKRLPEMLGHAPGALICSISLDAFEPFLILENVAAPIAVSASGGYLYIDAAALDIDLSRLTDLFITM